jgi:uncharacterized protein YcbK (DUF882 family)
MSIRADLIFFDAGGGHRAAATALRHVMERDKGQWEIRMVNLQELLDSLDVFRKVTGLRLQDIYNLMLRKKGHQVARDSQHTHGNAIDFALPTCTTPQLEKWAKAQKIGGVGVYLDSGFIHMDTGPIRSWDGE